MKIPMLGPCKRGHTGLRYAGSGCVVCVAARATKWNRENKERRAQINAKHAATSQRVKQYRTENKALLLAKRREHYAKNRDIELLRNAEYKRKNPQIVNACNASRRGAGRGAAGSFNKKDVQVMFASQNGECACCHIALTKYHVDHIMPVVLGGSNAMDNLQLLCPPCNYKKGAKHPDEWQREIAHA